MSPTAGDKKLHKKTVTPSAVTLSSTGHSRRSSDGPLTKRTATKVKKPLKVTNSYGLRSRENKQEGKSSLSGSPPPASIKKVSANVQRSDKVPDSTQKYMNDEITAIPKDFVTAPILLHSTSPIIRSPFLSPAPLPHSSIKSTSTDTAELLSDSLHDSNVNARHTSRSVATQTDDDLDPLHQRDALICELSDLNDKNSELFDSNSNLKETVTNLKVEICSLKKSLAEKSVDIESNLVECRITNSKISRLLRKNYKLMDELANNIDSNIDVSSQKNNVLLLGCSHGKSLAACLNEIRDKTNPITCTSIFKPNARIEDVVENLLQLTANFGKSDSVLIVSGTNNFMTDESVDIKNLVDFEFLDFLLDLVKKPKVFIHQMFPRYDINHNCQERFAKFINIFNCNLTKLAEKHENLHIINSDYLNRNDFTPHGLHMNILGKKKLMRNFLCGHTGTPFMEPQPCETSIESRCQPTNQSQNLGSPIEVIIGNRNNIFSNNNFHKSLYRKTAYDNSPFCFQHRKKFRRTVQE